MGSYKNTEIRKLPSDYLDIVTDILEEDEQWKRFMSLIPKNLADLTNDRYEPKYDSGHIRLIENYVRDLRPKVNYAKVMFSEWGTSGRIRPTVATVQDLLLKGEMYKAADQIARQLGEPLPQRPSNGPAARVDISVTRLLNEDTETQVISSNMDHCNGTTKQMESIKLSTKQFPKAEPASYKSKQTEPLEGISGLPISDILNPPTALDTDTTSSTNYSDSQSHYHPSQTAQTHDSYTKNCNSFYEQIQCDNLIQFSFKNVEDMTNNFTSRHLGSGSFGNVFLGYQTGLGEVAVKKAHDKKCSKQSFEVITKMFQTEVKSLSMLQHKNIVPIYGVSLDGLAPCIICEYVDGGSLKQKIAEKVLTENQRIKIMSGTAEGLKYIHNFEKSSILPTSQKVYFIHKDVKSANILLTKDLIPKLCDFGLAETFDMSIVQSEHINGTPAYMAPESSTGTITQKGDVYSYGIVMLEIITGKPAIVCENHEQMNIKDYVQENIVDGDIIPLLDKVVDNWVNGQNLYSIARLCLNIERTLRPTMDQIYIELQNI